MKKHISLLIIGFGLLSIISATHASMTSVNATNDEDILSATCQNIGTRSEGWYFPGGKLYKWANCSKEMQQNSGNNTGSIVAPKELNQETQNSTVGSGQMVGNDKDSHGCIGSAGYSWDTTSQKCIRPWEQKVVEVPKKTLSEKNHQQLNVIIEKLNTSKLQKVILNIDTAVSKIKGSSFTQAKKDNFLAQLEEIRSIIQEKLDKDTGANSTKTTNQ